MPSEKQYENKHIDEIVKRNKRVETIINYVAREFAIILSKRSGKLSDDFVFNKTVQKDFDKVLSYLHSSLLDEITEGMTLGYSLANEKTDDLVRKYISNLKLSDEVKAGMFNVNLGALQEFINRTINGLSLSDRVWDLCRSTQDEMEQLISSGILQGRSAAAMTKDIRKFLKEPNKLFRRVKDPQTGKLVLSNPAKNYNPGTGVYRSSFKNALRVTSNEINGANRLCDYTRRQELDFVTGVKIHLSGSHNVKDICDYMAGNYPKGFKFRGWHPNCFCYTSTLLLPQERFMSYLETGYIDKRYLVRKIPKQAEQYVNAKSDKLVKMNNKPYFFEDNFTNNGNLYKSVGQSRENLEPLKEINESSKVVNKKQTPFIKSTK